MQNLDLTISAWPDYELIDSGDNRKLERFGQYILIRPETQALWHPSHPQEWKRADAEFRFEQGGKGSWHNKPTFPASWEMTWNELRFIARPTSFKHTGIFPEQAANWEWIGEKVDALMKKNGAAPRVLNLFGYTGIASLVAAKHGAQVTHCDASKQSNTWAHDNGQLSGIDTIRFITDDALKFIEREVRRDVHYDGIILDPPAFGRGAKGEVFHIEEHLPKLLEVCARLLTKKPGSFFLLNGYAAGYAPQSLRQAVQGAFPESDQGGEFGELHIEEKSSERVVPSGIYIRFTRV